MKRIGYIDGRRISGWSFLNTDTPGDGQLVTINDRSPASCFGKKIVYNVLTAKTGLYARAHEIEVNLNADTVLGYASRISMQTSGNPVVIHGAGLEVYMNDPGDNTSGWMCLDLNFNCVGTPAGRYGFIKCRPHTAVTPRTLMLLEGAPTATYMLEHAQPNQAPFYDGAASAAGAELYHLKCLMGGMEVRVPLWFG